MSTHTDAYDDETHRVDRELAALRGHAEAREQLLTWGWPESDVEALESALSFYDFAQCVAAEARYRREGGRVDTASE